MYKLQTKYKVADSTPCPRNKDQGYSTLSTTRGSHLLLLDPIPSLHHAEEKIRNEKLQNRIELKTTVVILMLY